MTKFILWHFVGIDSKILVGRKYVDDKIVKYKRKYLYIAKPHPTFYTIYLLISYKHS